LLSLWADWSGANQSSENTQRSSLPFCAGVDDGPARSIGLFAGRPASSFIEHGSNSSWAFAELPSPRAKPIRGWRPAGFGPAPQDGRKRALFNGWFDNYAEIAAALGLPHTASDAEVYLSAVERWGDDADIRCIGSYCAAIADMDARSIRLSRSPWDGPPLYYHRSSEQAVVASVPRAIFAAGIPAQLNHRRQVQNLLYYHGDHDADWYHGVSMVRQGWITVLSPGGVNSRCFYDPMDYVGKRHSGKTGQDTAAQANALLEEAAGKALGKITRPAMLLSGGLDSPLAAAALLRRLPADQSLHSFTFTPLAQWDGRIDAGRMGDESALVREFSAMHPRLKPQFFSNDGVGFDHKSREMMVAMGIAPAGMTNLYMYHALYDAAAKAGCDGIISAGLGNFTYSSSGLWALGEQFRSLQWRALARNLRGPNLDWRSPARRFAAYVAMPMVPEGLRGGLRRLIKSKRPDWFLDAVTALNPKLRGSPEAMDGQGRPINPFEGTFHRDRQQDVADAIGGGAELESDSQQGFEQLYGLRQRDITAYRPLVEYCLSLPGEAFLADGTDRLLARRMGVGRLPESIRMNQLYGSHGVDWHVRMSAQRSELLAEMKRCAQDPELAALLDCDRLIAQLEDWPDEDPLNIEKSGPCFQGVTRAIWTSRFIHFVNGKN